MLRNNWVSLILLTLIGVSSLVACWSAIMWFRGAREAQALEFHYQRMNNTFSAVQALASEAAEFSLRHPSMETVLQEHNVRLRSVPVSTGSAPAKPATKP